MIGGIYENRSGKGAPYMVRFRNITRRFWSKREAERFLTGLRYEVDKGSFDPRDYRADKPLAFTNLVETYLRYKADRRSIGHIRCHLARAQDFFSDRNVKSITYGDLEDFILALRHEGLKDKTIANIMADLRAFFRWLERREAISAPEFPKVDYELGWRNVVDKETQQAIIAEVKRSSAHNDRKIGIAIEWLARYYAIRPIELLHIREGDFDFQLGGVNILYNKERRPKWVPMLQEDLELVRSFPPAINPELPFFRYKGRPYGRKRLYKWWKRACTNLGIEGVDLYGGTRHSTVRALRMR